MSESSFDDAPTLQLFGPQPEGGCPRCTASVVEGARFCSACGEALSPDAQAVGAVVGSSYRLEGLLARGSRGELYRARHLGLDRLAVVRLMRAGSDGAEAARRRLIEQARLASRFDHPNIVRVLDFGEWRPGEYFLASEFVAGATLEQEIRSGGAMAPARVAHIAEQILSALEVAHAAGVAHGELSARQVLLAERHGRADHVKVLGLGTAWDGGLDPARDLAAVGALIYQMLVGAVLSEDARAEAPPASRPLHAGLQAVTVRALSRAQHKDFGSAGEMREAIETAIKGGGPLRAVRREPVCEVHWRSAHQQGDGMVRIPDPSARGAVLEVDESAPALHILEAVELEMGAPDGPVLVRGEVVWIDRRRSGVYGIEFEAETDPRLKALASCF